MKRRQFLALAATTPLAACAGGFNLKDLGESKDTAVFTTETITMFIGFHVAKSENTALDTGLRAVYDLAVKGELSPEAVNTIIAAMNLKDPFQMMMIQRILRLAEMFGAQVLKGEDGTGTVVSLVEIDPVLLEACARGYVDGFNLFKSSKRAGFQA